MLASLGLFRPRIIENEPIFRQEAHMGMLRDLSEFFFYENNQTVGATEMVVLYQRFDSLAWRAIFSQLHLPSSIKLRHVPLHPPKRLVL